MSRVGIFLTDPQINLWNSLPQEDVVNKNNLDKESLDEAGTKVLTLLPRTCSLCFVFFKCSKSCGGGTRRRRAICVNTFNDVLDDSKCSQQEKLTVQRCSDFLCPQWKTGDWSEVSVSSWDAEEACAYVPLSIPA